MNDNEANEAEDKYVEDDLNTDDVASSGKMRKTIDFLKLLLKTKDEITLSRLLGRTPNWQDREIWISLSNNMLKFKAPPQGVLVFPFLSLV